MSEDKSNHQALPISYTVKHMEKILTLDRRVFKACEPKEVAQWSYRRMKTEKWLVHLSKYTDKWSIRKLP